MAHILIAEDEKPINNLLKKNLQLVGHTCHCVYDGDAVFTALANQDFDLMLLDVMMPKQDGFQVASQLNQLNQSIPIIFLTARSQVTDKVRGLKLGADDYIVKPFDMLELQARIETVLRRTSKIDETFRLGPVTIDFSAQQVCLHSQLVDLSPKEFLLIKALVKNRNIALSRDKLLDIVWEYDFDGDTRTVDVHIHAIRKKLGWEQIIKTVYKLGYRLEVPK